MVHGVSRSDGSTGTRLHRIPRKDRGTGGPEFRCLRTDWERGWTGVTCRYEVGQDLVV